MHFNAMVCKQEAICKFVGEGNWSNLQGSSRTDAGVHAVRNVRILSLWL